MDSKGKSGDTKVKQVVNNGSLTSEEETKKLNALILSQRLTTPKIIRDPIHDIIKIEDRIILRILDTKPMQRLKRIKQLGNAFHVYPGAVHTRFSHSLGVYHIACMMLSQIESAHEINEYDKLIVKLAAILHDVGHGAYSHLFEGVLKENYGSKDKEAWHHEEWSKNIIRTFSDIKGILDEFGAVFNKDIKEDVTHILSRTYSKNKRYLCDIVSSQFDADRFDYMLRDSHMSGVNYGKIDLKWLLRNLTIVNVEKSTQEDYEPKRLVINIRRGRSTLQQYLLGNLYLYQHVYWHKTVQAADAMIINIFKRAISIHKEFEQPILKEKICFDSDILQKIEKKEKLDIDEYVSLNDDIVLSWITTWASNSTDEILQKLSVDYLSRNLFKPIRLMDVSEKEEERGNFRLDARELDPPKSHYLIHSSELNRLAYKSLESDEIYFIKDESDIIPKKYSEINKHISFDDIDSAILSKLSYKEIFLLVSNKYKPQVDKLMEKYKNE